MSDTAALTISWTRAQADRQRTLFRRVLGLVLLAETALALVLILWPAWSASFSAWPVQGTAAWVRVAGVMWLVINLFQLPGWHEPVYQRWPNIVGLAWRFLLAVVCAGLGGYMWTFAALEIVVAATLSVLYWRLLSAELLCRP